MGAKEQSGRTWPSIFWARGTVSLKFLRQCLKPSDICGFIKCTIRTVNVPGQAPTYEIKITITVLVVYMARGVIILMGVKSISKAIGRDGP